MGCYVRPIALVFTTRLMLKKKIEIGGPCGIRTHDLRIKRNDVESELVVLTRRVVITRDGVTHFLSLHV